MAGLVSSETTISGIPRIIDGDTIAINDQTVRIEGIDAPELSQKCKRNNEETWHCGKAAATAIKTMIHDQAIECSGSERDSYGRLLALCKVGSIDIGEKLVRLGYAVAFLRYSQKYAKIEDISRTQRKGIWSTDFERPAEFRKRRWYVAAQQAPNKDCPIKGNINRKKERIYHTPWSRMYLRTKISLDKGEKWFCSEGDAIRAGWRAPLYD